MVSNFLMWYIDLQAAEYPRVVRSTLRYIVLIRYDGTGFQVHMLLLTLKYFKINVINKKVSTVL